MRLAPFAFALAMLADVRLSSAQAESAPMHYCSKGSVGVALSGMYVPGGYEPLPETAKWEIDHYRRCLQDFVEEQNADIRRHRAAADDAAREWREFKAALERRAREIEASH